VIQLRLPDAVLEPAAHAVLSIKRNLDFIGELEVVEAVRRKDVEIGLEVGLARSQKLARSATAKARSPAHRGSRQSTARSQSAHAAGWRGL